MSARPDWKGRVHINGRDWSQDEREARLERTSANQRERLARESQDEREARLERTSANRLARESQDEREVDWKG